MPQTDVLVAFAMATLVFGYMPGPGMLYATAQTLAGGRRAGAMAALGLHVGGYAHVIAAAFGLALVFQMLPVLYTVLKLAGAGYLIWLGIGLLRPARGAAQGLPKVTAGNAAFGQSVLVEVLNPKTALFYVAFLPQFTQSSASLPLWAQLLVLGTVVNLVFSSADLVCVVGADRVRVLVMRSARAAFAVRRLGGAILIGLGVFVAFGRG